MSLLIDAQYSATEDSVLPMATSRSVSPPIFEARALQRVELILCFNQPTAPSLRPSSTRKSGCFAAGRIDDYCQHQLSSMLIRRHHRGSLKTAEPASSSARLLCRDLAGHRTNLAISRSRASSSSGRERRAASGDRTSGPQHPVIQCGKETQAKASVAIYRAGPGLRAGTAAAGSKSLSVPLRRH